MNRFGSSKLRRRIAWEAACLLVYRRETEVYRAKLVAGRRVCGGWVPQFQLPTNREVHEEVLRLSSPGASSDEPPQVPPEFLDSLEMDPEFADDSTAYDPQASYIRQFDDRYDQFRLLLRPLEHVAMPRGSHPEGDALFHSLQVFELARQRQGYDEEFLTAALMHEVGRAICLKEPVTATLSALAELISPRSAWLIENIELGHRIYTGSIGHRSHKRLSESADYDDLILLAECDRLGRQPQSNVPDLDTAVDLIRTLADGSEES